MFRAVAAWVIIILAGMNMLQAANLLQSSNADLPASAHRAVLTRYCITCHNEKLKTAGLMLDKADIENPATDASVWEKVVRKLRASAMPPAGMPRPDKTSYDSLAAYLETSLDTAASAKPNPGRPVIRRLNRTEYANAIQDLLSLEIDSQSLLPPDTIAEGFDNIASSLSISPALMERYLVAAKKISRLAIGDPGIGATVATYKVPQYLRQEERVGDDFPFFSRGGFAIHYRFPLDGEYYIKIGLRKNIDVKTWGLEEGQGEPHQIEVRVDGARIKVFTIGGERKGKKRMVNNHIQYEDDPDIAGYETHADDGMEFRFPVKAGTRVLTVSFVEPAEPEGVLRPRPLTDLLHGDNPLYKDGDPVLDTVTLGGPYGTKAAGETASRGKIFLCHPSGSQKDEDLCAKKILSTLARGAYRRPVSDSDLQVLMNFYSKGRSGGGFETGIEWALQRLLVSPDFLFRVEVDPPNVPPDLAYRVSDIELASRLSFFFWSSIPDDELINLAVRGKLKDPAVLEQQVRRMLADSRSSRLVRNFVGQWLMVRNMEKVIPDAEVLPEFDDELRDAFQQETYLFFQSMLQDDRSLLDLLNADYTFLNERLAKHYGISGVIGDQFRRVALKDENRRGLLGQGSVLTVTSYPNRTSVVLRGKWLLDNLLGTPPPPPPPDVPALKVRNADGKMPPLRQLMEQHRANAVCATCHSQMDPLGFALENFDAIGKWRDANGDDNIPIDSSGVLMDGTKFRGPAELRKALLQHPEEIAVAITEKLLTYAIGRSVEYYDAPVVRKIVRDAAPGGYRWSSIILGIVKSTPFQMRRSQPS